ncbi:transposase, partial [Streptomyces sp. NPDC056227]
ADRKRRERYAAVTTAVQPQRLGAVTETEARDELASSAQADLSRLALPDLIPPAAPPPEWRTPPSLAARTRHALPPNPPSRHSPPGPDTAADTTSEGEPR